MYRQMNDFHLAFDGLTGATRRLFDQLTDENIGTRVGDCRTLGQIAWHIVTTYPEMMNQVGLGLASVDHESMPPEKAEAIREAYQKVTLELSEALKAHWTDASLGESDVLYGEEWTRGRTLKILLDHEIHHRGQMTTVLRLAGGTVPGLFGPSREEWTQYGQEAPPY